MPNIQDFKEKIKCFVSDDGAFMAVLLVLASLTAFGLGRQSASSEASYISNERVSAAVQTTIPERLPVVSGQVRAASTTSQYVASKNSDKYHLPWCSGAARIADANKIYFNSREEAESAGYTPAANCPGL